MTAKELAEILGVSPTAVSFALNGKPGISTKTRNRIKDAALEYGLIIPGEHTGKGPVPRTIYLIYYQKSGLLLPILPFSNEVSEGVEQAAAAAGCSVHILHVGSTEQLTVQLEELSHLGEGGVILFGTDMSEEDFRPLSFQKIPIVLLDNHFYSSKVDSVTINNVDSAYAAASYLIRKKHVMPGYLHSSYPISNFEERRLGFERALVHHGYSRSAYIRHTLASSIEGACADMLRVLEEKDALASCYFADNDFIAIGAMKAFREKGYRIPEDISVIGFDDIDLCNYTEPGLTTVHVPKKYMGMIAAQRLLTNLENKDYYPINIRISTNLVVRGSVK